VLTSAASDVSHTRIRQHPISGKVVRFGAVSKCIAEGAVAWKAPPVAAPPTFSLATNEYRGANAGERTEYHSLVAWDRLAEVCGQFLGKGQLVDVEGQQIDRLLPVRWSMSDDAPFEP